MTIKYKIFLFKNYDRWPEFEIVFFKLVDYSKNLETIGKQSMLCIHYNIIICTKLTLWFVILVAFLSR